MAEQGSYDLILVGTGFASSFFLWQLLRAERARHWRILVLERGGRDLHSWRLQHRSPSSTDFRGSFEMSGDPEKDWVFTLGFGGGSNCWYACTPRMLPEDFRLQSLYGTGRDWPLSYEELQPYYETAEEIMQVSGPSDGTPFPKARPYPQPPHRFTDPDRLLKAKFPDQFFEQPTARARLPVRGRPACCASSVCHVCPVDAKFTIDNGMAGIYEDPRIELKLHAEVLGLQMKGGAVQSVHYRQGGVEQDAHADLVALGANALFNPLILQRSGLAHPLLGKRLHEQGAIEATAYLDGVDNFQGSTIITGHGYMLYGGAHRRESAAGLIETWNKPMIRMERGRWRQQWRLKIIVEDLPLEDNHVRASPSNPEKPVAHFAGRSEYFQRGVERAQRELPRVLQGLPIERLEFVPGVRTTEAHILGTTVMGQSAQDSVVDGALRHHQARNLLVLGGSVFPTGAPANPTLTLSALSLRAADLLLGGRA